MRCKICGEESGQLFKMKVLEKFMVQYYLCADCEFIQTEEPYWIDEAYAHPVLDIDTGIFQRNILLAKKTEFIIDKNFSPDKKFLEYASGYGILTRLMRDKGYDFYCYDKYCDVLFASPFDIGKNLDKANTQFEMITAFSIFEHWINPLEELKKILALTDAVLFNEELHPLEKERIQNWWMLMPECGQHISFYSFKTLSYIAKQLNCNFYSDGQDFHLFTKKKLKSTILLRKDNFFTSVLSKISLSVYKFSKRYSHHSFTSSDYDLAKKIFLKELNIHKPMKN